MSKERGVKTDGLLRFLADEDVLTQKGVKAYAFFGFPGQQLFDEFIDFFDRYVLIDDLVDHFLGLVFDGDAGAGASEESQP